MKYLWVIDAFKRKMPIVYENNLGIALLLNNRVALGAAHENWYLPFDPKKGALLTQFQKHKNFNL